MRFVLCLLLSLSIGPVNPAFVEVAPIRLKKTHVDSGEEYLEGTAIKLENCEILLRVEGKPMPIVFRFEASKNGNQTKACWHTGAVEWKLCSKQPKGFDILQFVNNAKFEECELSRYCEPEVFHHFYRVRGNKLQAHDNRWQRAKAGERACLHDVCLKPNGVPLTRKCLYNSQRHKAEWENTSTWQQIVCLKETREQIITTQLNTLHDDVLTGKRFTNNTAERHHILRDMRELFAQRNCKLLPADVHLTSQLLGSVTENVQDETLVQDIVEICNSFMAADDVVLRMSAMDLNATNHLLDTFETYLDSLTELLIPQTRCGQPINLQASPVNNMLPKLVETLDLSHIGVYALMSANLSVFFVNPSCAQISGIAIYAANTKVSKKPLSYAAQNSFLYRFIQMNESTASLLQETGLETAAFLPTSLWQSLAQQTMQQQQQKTLLVLKVYAHDALFVESTLMRSRKPYSKVLSISIPGYRGQLPEEFPFILRNKHYQINDAVVTAQGTGCGYWNYSSWVSDGVQTKPNEQRIPKELILCSTNHLTSFSYLLGGSYKTTDPSGDVLITPLHLAVLDIISIIGCSLSLLGLLGIWLTAVLFKSWRTLASTKVLLNLCLALTFQMILFVFVNTDDMSEHLIEERSFVKCIALGALMQYSILVLFSWMLIAAFLQFQRYVQVIGIQRPPHYIIKSAVATWGFPLIPTLLVAFIDPHCYIPTDYQLRSDTGICYPSGNALVFGVILPVALIVLANLTIFIYVCWSISHTLSQSMQMHERKFVMNQIRLSVLLFFLLGLTWIFGIFAFMKAGIVFSYLFCLTATMQGFVLFIFFVILDKTTQKAWSNLLCPKRHKGQSNKATENQSIMATVSTSVTASATASADKP